MNEGCFRDARYDRLNQCRWEQFLSMGIDLRGRNVFEPGAGIGDQTEWLLEQGVRHIYVNDGRPDNLNTIKERFGDDFRLSYVLGDLETDLPFDFPFVDFIFCWGVYYHLRETTDFRILKQLSKMGETIAMDYLEGTDNEVSYGYDNPSTSLSQYAFRPRTETLLQAMTDTFGYAYIPKQQLEWIDPLAHETRLVAVASHFLLDNPNLIRFNPLLTQNSPIDGCNDRDRCARTD